MQPTALIAVLLDTGARIDERDDAAMDLGNFDGGEVEEALLRVAADPSEDLTIQGSAGESLMTIWLRRGDTAFPHLAKLSSAARSEAAALLQAATRQTRP
jgi:hypothetical protein